MCVYKQLTHSLTHSPTHFLNTTEVGAGSSGRSKEAGDEERPYLLQKVLYATLHTQQELPEGPLALTTSVSLEELFV